tara:strand:+ start:3067 stop:3213 length:147 start_codon:yes stop_codon:yes gene_type:complete
MHINEITEFIESIKDDFTIDGIARGICQGMTVAEAKELAACINELIYD